MWKIRDFWHPLKINKKAVKHLNCLKHSSQDYKVIKHGMSPSKVDSMGFQMGWWEYDISSYFFGFSYLVFLRRSHHRVHNKYFWPVFLTKDTELSAQLYCLQQTMSDKNDACNILLCTENPQIQNIYQKSNHYKMRLQTVNLPFYPILIFLRHTTEKEKNNADQVHRWGDNYIPPTQNRSN